MEKVKLGVFGAGRGMAMVNQILSDPKAELVAVCDRYKPLLDNCKKVAEEASMCDIAYYENFEDFFKHDMDAVVLANNANEHVPFAIRLMESGRHVMTECLTCATMKEAVELIEAVERTGMVYAYAENYCYTPVRWEMRQRYRRGDIGELMYAEGEYLHDCSSIWPEITYGDRNHWRNWMSANFYCTHSIGPILYMTGLRPVQVTGFQTKNMPFMRELGCASGTLGMEIVTLENGAILKSLHFGIKHYRESNYQLSGTLGTLQDMGDDTIGVYMEKGPGMNCQGERENYKPEPAIAGSENTAHGGGDYYPTHYFIRAILGDPVAKERSINVYDAVDMCIPGTLAYISVVEGNKPIQIPNLRNKEERDAWRNDTRCTFPDIAGDQLLPNNLWGDPEIPDSVYAEVKRRWEAGEPG